jgi:hypothetical protein
MITPHKKKEVPPIILAECVSRVIITPDADTVMLAAIDVYKKDMSAEVRQTKRTFKVRVKTRKLNGKKQTSSPRGRYSKTTDKQ